MVPPLGPGTKSSPLLLLSSGLASAIAAPCLHRQAPWCGLNCFPTGSKLMAAGWWQPPGAPVGLAMRELCGECCSSHPFLQGTLGTLQLAATYRAWVRRTPTWSHLICAQFCGVGAIVPIHSEGN